MKRILLSFLFFIPLLLVAQTKVDVGSFEHVSVSTSIEATIVQSNTHKVEYTMIKGSADNLKIKNDNGRLKVTTKSNKGWGNKTKAKVTIHTPSLKSIKGSAGGSIRTDGTFEANKLTVDGSSGSSIKLELMASEINCDVSSGASIKLAGETKHLEVDASSGSSFRAGDLKSKSVEADASSGASVKIWATESIDADASSGASVSYKGNPSKTNIDKGVSGSIRKM